MTMVTCETVELYTCYYLLFRCRSTSVNALLQFMRVPTRISAASSGYVRVPFEFLLLALLPLTHFNPSVKAPCPCLTTQNFLAITFSSSPSSPEHARPHAHTHTHTHTHTHARAHHTRTLTAETRIHTRTRTHTHTQLAGPINRALLLTFLPANKCTYANFLFRVYEFVEFNLSFSPKYPFVLRVFHSLKKILKNVIKKTFRNFWVSGEKRQFGRSLQSSSSYAPELSLSENKRERE